MRENRIARMGRVCKGLFLCAPKGVGGGAGTTGTAALAPFPKRCLPACASTPKEDWCPHATAKGWPSCQGACQGCQGGGGVGGVGARGFGARLGHIGQLGRIGRLGRRLWRHFPKCCLTACASTPIICPPSAQSAVSVRGFQLAKKRPRGAGAFWGGWPGG